MSSGAAWKLYFQPPALLLRQLRRLHMQPR